MRYGPTGTGGEVVGGGDGGGGAHGTKPRKVARKWILLPSSRRHYQDLDYSANSITTGRDLNHFAVLQIVSLR